METGSTAAGAPQRVARRPRAVKACSGWLLSATIDDDEAFIVATATTP